MSEKNHHNERIPLIYMIYGLTTVCMLLFSMVLFIHNAYAATSTAISSVRGLPGVASIANPQVLIKTSFSGAQSSNLDITYTWKVDDGNDNFDTPLGTDSTGTGLTSPHQYVITALDNSQTYRVRVDFSDPGGNDTIILAGLKTHNPLIHNAVSTGSEEDLWTGGWGISGGQYGEFTCSTCHERLSGNIKRIRKDWSDPALPDVPAAQYNATVVFNSTDQFAKDDTFDHIYTYSDGRICESCHTRTAHHQCDMSDDDAFESEVDHHSDKDCISCHKHSAGFGLKGGCSACHGGSLSGANGKNIWPDSIDELTDGSGSADDAGEHLAHITVLAQLKYSYNISQLLDSTSSLGEQKALCNYCHENPGSDADHADGDDAEVTRFLEMDNSIDNGSFDYDYLDTSTSTCSNVECHNNKTTTHWYAGSSVSCITCHTTDNSNASALADPTTGLHQANASFPDVEGHDVDFYSSAGTCTSCHQDEPSDGHINSIYNTPATVNYNFYNSATHPSLSTFEVDLGTLSDTTDDTCAADCHTDQGYWYRKWSQDAYFTFDPETFDNTSALPAGCDVCHGMFGSWAEGSSHAGTYDGIASTKGSSHNGPDEAGTLCEDCHVFPSVDKHNNGEDKITLNDSNGDDTLEDSSGINPVYNGTDDAWSCEPCHTDNPLPPISNSYAYPDSQAFTPERIAGAYTPSGSCFSGEWTSSCHGYIDEGSNIERWWPEADPRMHDDLSKHPGDPANETHETVNFGYPNRAGAHHEHNITIGELVCEKRTGSPCSADPTDGLTDPTDEDYNATCIFCHPMTVQAGVLKATNHYDGVVDVYGGYTYDDLVGTSIDKGRGIANSDPSGVNWTKYDAIPGDGYIYQLDDPNNPGVGVYPLDTDGEYRQYLYNYRTANNVNHGTCSNIACHSNAPFTPNWYGDDQAPAQITTLRAYTSASQFDAAEVAYYNGESHYDVVGLDDDCQDVPPGAVLLTWLAPGDNGNFDGTAYEYEVYYSTGVINDGNVDSAARVGGAPTVHRQDELQCMIVEGLTPSGNYYFAVRTKDQPKYCDPDDDDVYDKFVEDGNVSLVAATSSTVAAHADDVAPVFWGLDQAESHDTGGVVNLRWDAARDHSLPITYRVYWSEYSLKTHLSHGGSLPTSTTSYNDNTASGGDKTPTTPGSDYTIYTTTTTALAYQVTGLDPGVLYNFLARAEDNSGNLDNNVIVLMALSSKLPQEATTTALYLLDGANTLEHQLDPMNPDWNTVATGVVTGGVTFTSGDLDDDISGGSISRDYWVNGISLDMHVVNGDRRSPNSFTVEFGYDDGSQTPFPVSLPATNPITVTAGRLASRIIKIGLSALEGKVPADASLYVKIVNTSGDLTLRWGEDDRKGQLLINAQPINKEPTAPSTFTVAEIMPDDNGYVEINWSGATDGDSAVTQPLHYDIYGSIDGGTTWPYLIGTGLSDSNSPVIWDTVGDGLITDNLDCVVKLEVSDGYLYETTPGSGVWFSHNQVTTTASDVDNGSDTEAPAEVEITHVEPRPKQGSAYLHWLAVGNDGYNHGTRAGYYDVRFRKASDGVLTDANWTDAATVEAQGEPVPGFAGTAQTFELLDMTPDTDYQVAIKTCDDDNNCSDLSNVYTITSGQYYCGICHSTPPDEPETSGIHREHGYTLEDCAKCHGDGSSESGNGNDVTRYDGRHYDGVINIGWGRDSIGGAQSTLQTIAPTKTSNVTIAQGGSQIYVDPDGSGGYNAPAPYNPSTPKVNTDSGSCMNFIAVNATGCHGPFEPKWASDTDADKKEPHCADCHGANGLSDPSTREKDPYDRYWDANIYNATSLENDIPTDQIMASPPLPNRDEISGVTEENRYVGAHERHLNASFRFAKEDSCRLCHKDTMEQGLHADGNIDIVFDSIADQDELNKAVFDQNHGTVDDVGMSCGSLNNLYCHDNGANWAEPGAKCNSCHGMAGKAYVEGAGSSEIGHVMGQDGVVEACTYCHVSGHPQSPDGVQSGDTNALLINNNPVVGINYKSGGIHLRKTYGWGSYDTLAEICWGCHDQNNDGDLNDVGDISEWGTNTSSATGSSGYNFGTLNQKQWTGAVWNSGYGQTSSDPFWYKRGYIQSTHTTDSTGVSTVSWDRDNGRYNETADNIANIRCSNCHDVHDSNLAPGDTMSGRPYLRGTWMSNPYEEDGAPYNTTYTEADGPSINYGFGAVPRGGTRYSELGGYYIDQNNIPPGTGLGFDHSSDATAHYPTSGWTVQSSAGLCVLCHGSDVDSMDQVTDSDALWLGNNGHSNSALGGTFSEATNIFDYTHGRPSPRNDTFDNKGKPDGGETSTVVPDMAFVSQGDAASAGGGYRSDPEYTSRLRPYVTATTTFTGGNNNTFYVPVAYNGYDWGATVDADTEDRMYHQFSCSKCHNPHASRLPKLMITNCLDIRHNTWDDNQATPYLQTLFTHSDLDDVDDGMPAAYYASAQNCHRYDGRRSTSTLRGGWNKVTPWARTNYGTASEADHKGGDDPAYAPRDSN